MTIGEKELLGFRKELQSRERSDATIEKYMRDTRKSVQFTAGTELTKEKVIAYKNQLIKEGYTPSASLTSLRYSVLRFRHC